MPMYNEVPRLETIIKLKTEQLAILQIRHCLLEKRMAYLLSCSVETLKTDGGTLHKARRDRLANIVKITLSTLERKAVGVANMDADKDFEIRAARENLVRLGYLESTGSSTEIR